MTTLMALALSVIPAAALALDAGFPLPEQYAKRVSDGIERYRKADAVVRVVDRHGKPVKGAKVEVRQVSHDFLFGCAFPSWDISKKQPDPETWAKFERYFLTLFNYTTTENMIKWHTLEREEGKPNYRLVDAFVSWCIEHRIKVKGHNLVWGWPWSYPKWLEKYPPEEVAEKVRSRIKDVVGRYKGKIDVWDVVNEPLHADWFETHMSRDYTEKALKWAREANPKATLLVNEYGCQWGEAERYAAYCLKLIGSGAPLDAIGEQAHDPPRIPSPKQIFDMLDRLSEVGKDIHLTEMTMPSDGKDVESDFVQGKWTPEMQGRYYRYYYTLAFSHPKVKAITLWAMWDGHSWLGQGGIIAKDWTPKPAYNELDSLINREWRTNLSGTTEADGAYRFRGFHGDYEVKVTARGKTATAKMHVAEGGKNAAAVRLE